MLAYSILPPCYLSSFLPRADTKWLNIRLLAFCLSLFKPLNWSFRAFILLLNTGQCLQKYYRAYLLPEVWCYYTFLLKFVVIPASYLSLSVTIHPNKSAIFSATVVTPSSWLLLSLLAGKMDLMLSNIFCVSKAWVPSPISVTARLMKPGFGDLCLYLSNVLHEVLDIQSTSCRENNRSYNICETKRSLSGCLDEHM